MGAGRDGSSAPRRCRNNTRGGRPGQSVDGLHAIRTRPVCTTPAKSVPVGFDAIPLDFSLFVTGPIHRPSDYTRTLSSPSFRFCSFFYVLCARATKTYVAVQIPVQKRGRTIEEMTGAAIKPRRLVRTGDVGGRRRRRRAGGAAIALVPLILLALAAASRASDSCDWTGR